MPSSLASTTPSRPERWYAQVKERRGSKKAIVALARRILVITWAMIRDNTTFLEPDPDKNQNTDQLHTAKLRAMAKKAQRSTRTISMWKALHLLATDQKLRTDLGLPRIIRPSKPV